MKISISYNFLHSHHGYTGNISTISKTHSNFSNELLYFLKHHVQFIQKLKHHLNSSHPPFVYQCIKPCMAAVYGGGSESVWHCAHILLNMRKNATDVLSFMANEKLEQTQEAGGVRNYTPCRKYNVGDHVSAYNNKDITEEK
jgi:hypothetical protein